MHHQNQSKHTSISSIDEVLQRGKKSRIHLLIGHYEDMVAAIVLELSAHLLARVLLVPTECHSSTKSPCIGSIFLF